MSDLVAPVNDGQVNEKSSTSSSSKSKLGSSNLGKDQFLQLLVTQMKYQDPLNPSSDTEYVAQLATFSQLEQMQNLNATTVNSQAFNLVGKEVIISSTNSSGSTETTQGVVDFVTISSGKAYLSIDGTLYSADDLQSVIGEDYLAGQNAPTVAATAANFDLANPTDVKVKISLGNKEYAATSVAVVINGAAVPSDKLSYSNGTLTINKDAFTSLGVGKHAVVIGFNDTAKTTITDKVTVTVNNTAA